MEYLEREQTSSKLRRSATSLAELIIIYEGILNGEIYATAELKKTVQDSIKEFCAVVLDKTHN